MTDQDNTVSMESPENIADNEEFEIISNPDLEDLEGKRKPRDVGRTISVTSDELLGVVRVNESPMDDDSLEFHDTADDQQFEVLESTGVVKSDSSEMQPQEENIEAEGSPKDSVPSLSSSAEEEKSGDSESTSSKDKDQESKRSISPIRFDESQGGEEPKDSKNSKDKSSGKSSTREKSKDHRHSGPHRITDKLFSNTRYFIIKSNNFDNVDIAKDKNVWSTPAYNEKRLNKAYRECRNVLLVFSVRESGRFQGIARLISESRHDGQRIQWVLPPHISQSQLGGVFKLDWLHRGELDFSACMDLKNPWNENKPVKISRDGQEVEPGVGEKLCQLWAKIASDDDILTDPSVRRDNQDQRTSGRNYGGHSGSHDFHPRHTPMPYHPHPMFNPYGYAHMSAAFYRPMTGDARNQIGHPAMMHPPSKHQLEAEALLDSKKRKVEYRKSSSSTRSSERRVESHHSRHESRRSGEKGRKVEKRSQRKKEKHSRRRSRTRSQSRSSDSSFEDDYGVKKETLLHGSYADYVKEYKSRSGGGGEPSSSGRGQGESSAGNSMPSVAQIASAYQKALSDVATALQQQQGSASSKMDPKMYAKKVEEFLSKKS
ncbi:YTH domain-containing protein 1-like [Halichondria panicea]|uniref:YTH domain-containing protein 1-like n=1 Tax=Halichondria panicea TaxID=6063 RepID=UPI00312BB1ED